MTVLLTNCFTRLDTFCIKIERIFLYFVYCINMLLISRAIRFYNKIPTPYMCYAFQHLPESLNDVCDCKNHCKYNPNNGGFKNDFTFINKGFKPVSAYAHCKQ